MGLLGPKGAPKVGPKAAHPKGLYKQREGAPKNLNPGYYSRVDFVEVLRLLHKDEPLVRWFTQLHCRLPSELHRRATEVPQPRV
jgi:hypothetical protein